MTAADLAVGVIGLGEMGLPMALRVRGAGHRVLGYDVRDEAGRGLVAGGGEVAASPGDVAARSDVTIVMVRTPAQAEAVVLGAGGVLERARRGTVLIVMSTVGVPSMRRLAEAARRAGLRFLDAPVSGGRARAEDGTLTIIVGGAAADVEAARPVLAAMGTQIEHVGDAGAGTTVKMANQVILTVSLLAAREMAALTGAAGLATDKVWDVLRTCTGTTWVVEHWPVAREWVEGYRPGTSLDILVKDTGLALETAREAGVPAPMLGLASQLIVGLTRELTATSGRRK
ncbi:MAG TPA: NAD(P)-dependent oxidoreductase [bacterium]|nr:NAD(P)-dependent oxidoreductase [bacterium]